MKNNETFSGKDKGIIKRFQKGEITLERAHDLILRCDKRVVDTGLMYLIFQTIMPNT